MIIASSIQHGLTWPDRYFFSSKALIIELQTSAPKKRAGTYNSTISAMPEKK